MKFNVKQMYLSKKYLSCPISCAVCIALFAGFLCWLSYQKYQAIIASLVSIIGLIFVAVITARNSIHKYHEEKRMERFQKIYIEDALLGVISEIERVLLVGNDCKMKTVHMLELCEDYILDSSIGKDIYHEDYLKDIFEYKINSIEFSNNFKKKSLEKLISDVFENRFSSVISWIEKVEKDVVEFISFVKNQVRFAKYVSINDLPKEDQLKCTIELINKAFLFLERHEVLYVGLSNIALEYMKLRYKNVKEMKSVLAQQPLNSMFERIDKGYQNLIKNYEVKFGRDIDLYKVDQLKDLIRNYK